MHRPMDLNVNNLVLGYLKLNKFSTAAREFESECRILRKNHLHDVLSDQEHLVPNLESIIREYHALKKAENSLKLTGQAAAINNLWQQFDAIVTQLRCLTTGKHRLLPKAVHKVNPNSRYHVVTASIPQTGLHQVHAVDSASLEKPTVINDFKYGGEAVSKLPPSTLKYSNITDEKITSDEIDHGHDGLFKSPKRKRIRPKRNKMQETFEELPSINIQSDKKAAATSICDEMNQIFDTLLNSKDLQEKIADNINKCVTSSGIPSPSNIKTFDNDLMNSHPTINVDEILNMTRTDPSFESLFNLLDDKEVSPSKIQTPRPMRTDINRTCPESSQFDPLQDVGVVSDRTIPFSATANSLPDSKFRIPDLSGFQRFQSNPACNIYVKKSKPKTKLKSQKSANSGPACVILSGSGSLSNLMNTKEKDCSERSKFIPETTLRNLKFCSGGECPSLVTSCKTKDKEADRKCCQKERPEISHSNRTSSSGFSDCNMIRSPVLFGTCKKRVGEFHHGDFDSSTGVLHPDLGDEVRYEDVATAEHIDEAVCFGESVDKWSCTEERNNHEGNVENMVDKASQGSLPVSRFKNDGFGSVRNPENTADNCETGAKNCKHKLNRCSKGLESRPASVTDLLKENPNIFERFKSKDVFGHRSTFPTDKKDGESAKQFADEKESAEEEGISVIDDNLRERLFENVGVEFENEYVKTRPGDTSNDDRKSHTLEGRVDEKIIRLSSGEALKPCKGEQIILRPCSNEGIRPNGSESFIETNATDGNWSDHADAQSEFNADENNVETQGSKDISCIGRSQRVDCYFIKSPKKIDDSSDHNAFPGYGEMVLSPRDNRKEFTVDDIKNSLKEERKKLKEELKISICKSSIFSLEKCRPRQNLQEDHISSPTKTENVLSDFSYGCLSSTSPKKTKSPSRRISTRTSPGKAKCLSPKALKYSSPRETEDDSQRTGRNISPGKTKGSSKRKKGSSSVSVARSSPRKAVSSSPRRAATSSPKKGTRSSPRKAASRSTRKASRSSQSTAVRSSPRKTINSSSEKVAYSSPTNSEPTLLTNNETSSSRGRLGSNSPSLNEPTNNSEPSSPSRRTRNGLNSMQNNISPSKSDNLSSAVLANPLESEAQFSSPRLKESSFPTSKVKISSPRKPASSSLNKTLRSSLGNTTVTSLRKTERHTSLRKPRSRGTTKSRKTKSHSSIDSKTNFKAKENDEFIPENTEKTKIKDICKIQSLTNSFDVESKTPISASITRDIITSQSDELNITTATSRDDSNPDGFSIISREIVSDNSSNIELNIGNKVYIANSLKAENFLIYLSDDSNDSSKRNAFDATDDNNISLSDKINVDILSNNSLTKERKKEDLNAESRGQSLVSKEPTSLRNLTADEKLEKSTDKQKGGIQRRKRKKSSKSPTDLSEKNMFKQKRQKTIEHIPDATLQLPQNLDIDGFLSKLQYSIPESSK